MGLFKKIKRIGKRAIAATATGGASEVLRLTGNKSTALGLESLFTTGGLQALAGVGPSTSSTVVIGGPQSTASSPNVPGQGIAGGPVAFSRLGTITPGGNPLWRSSGVSTISSQRASQFSGSNQGRWVSSGTSVRRLSEPAPRRLVRL